MRVTFSDQEKKEVDALCKHFRVTVAMALRMAVAAEYKRHLGHAA